MNWNDPEYVRRYWQRYRKKHPDYKRTRVSREIRNVHAAVERAVKRGDLVKEPCEECGSEESVVAHHEDYSKPLDVIWLCRRCHRKVHA